MALFKFLNLGSIAKDDIVRTSLAWSGIFAALTILSFLYYYHLLPPLIPLFYSLVKGENQLSPKVFLTVIPVASFVFFLTHVFLTYNNFPGDKMFARIMSATSTLISFLFLIALVHILLLVL
jgi:hypothetical protein